jgi:hypothetical protein
MKHHKREFARKNDICYTGNPQDTQNEGDLNEACTTSDSPYGIGSAGIGNVCLWNKHSAGIAHIDRDFDSDASAAADRNPVTPDSNTNAGSNCNSHGNSNSDLYADAII